jgi:signal transduction histidine kinase
MTRPPLPTREARARRRALTESFGDEELARRLVEIGFATEEEVKTRLGAVGATQLTTHLDRLEAPARIGRSLRNVLSGAERITGLVGSLRSFARPEREAVEGVDVNATLEDSLALLGHALREVKVVREYGEVSRITCQVGALGQVWTNLISNALQAMGGTGTLQLVTESPAPDNVAVHIIDSGPGISPEDIEQIFDLNFTTRQGPADFGLGLGLPISRDIVARHGGAIAVDSKPGRTCFTVTLPVNGGAALKEREDAQP